MNIINYINSKNKCCVFNLTKNEQFVEELNLKNYPCSNIYEQSDENIFSNKDLAIFIISSDKVKDKTIFKLASKHNNVVVYVTNDLFMQNNETQCKNIFISYGYKCHGKTAADKV